MKKKFIYVTFHINTFSGYTPIAVKCNTLEEALAVAADVDSLYGYSNLRLNKSGRFRKDAIVADETEYWDYNNRNVWETLYYDKTFNPEYFPQNPNRKQPYWE